MALPRTQVVLATAARFAAKGALALRAERTAVLRSREVDILVVVTIGSAGTAVWLQSVLQCEEEDG